MDRLNMSLSRKQVEELLNYFDTDNDGLILTKSLKM